MMWAYWSYGDTSPIVVDSFFVDDTAQSTDTITGWHEIRFVLQEFLGQTTPVFVRSRISGQSGTNPITVDTNSNDIIIPRITADYNNLIVGRYYEATFSYRPLTTDDYIDVQLGQVKIVAGAHEGTPDNSGTTLDARGSESWNV